MVDAMPISARSVIGEDEFAEESVAPTPAELAYAGAIISLRDIRKIYTSATDEEVHVLNGLNLDIEAGSFNVIRGESGSGKTTLLRILGMLDSRFDGTYLFAGIDVKSQPDWYLDELRSNNIGFIFQDGRLFDHFDIRENISLPVRLLGSAEDRRLLSETIEQDARGFFTASELEDKKILSSRPPQVSGGQKQRASIMRAVINKPAVILADEPTASLDVSRKQEILKDLRSLCAAGHTVIVVSHDSVFHGAGRQFELVEGVLTEIGGEEDRPEALLTVREPEAGSSLLFGWKPRAPLSILLRQAGRETFTRWIFFFLVVTSLCVGVAQIGVFSSVIVGAQAFIEDAMTKGSRLNRLQIKPRSGDYKEDERFPATEEIRAWGNVAAIVPRREAVSSLQNFELDRPIQYTGMGLHPDDPEYRLLDFVAGGAFSGDHDELEVIVTVGLLPDLFEDTSGLQDGTKTYADFVGKPVTMMVPKYTPDGKLFKWTPVQLAVRGIILHGEGGRQIYLPNTTQLVFEAYKRDKAGRVALPLTPEGNAWTDKAEVKRLADFPWEDQLHIYTTEIREIIPVFQQLSKLGYKPQSDVWEVKWVLDVQDLTWNIFLPLLLLIVIAVIVTVASNIVASAKLREKEFALWRILGMRRGDLVLTQVISTAFMVLTGTLIGLLVAGGLVSWARSFLTAEHADENYAMVFAPVGQFFLPILIAAVVVGILSAIIPAARTANAEPAKVLQS